MTADTSKVRNAITTGAIVLVLAALAWWWLVDSPVHVGPGPSPQGRVLILLHGHGASKTDLEPLAKRLSKEAPRYTFIMPSAPHRTGVGRTWYPSFTVDSQEELIVRLAELRKEARGVVGEIIAELRDDGVPEEAIYVGGFSQGATVALDVVMHEPGLGGLVSLSGGALDLDLAPLEEREVLRAFVSHGKRDRVLGGGKSKAIADALEAGEHEVDFVTFDGGHAIPDEVVDALAAFLRDDV